MSEWEGLLPAGTMGIRATLASLGCAGHIEAVEASLGDPERVGWCAARAQAEGKTAEALMLEWLLKDAALPEPSARAFVAALVATSSERASCAPAASEPTSMEKFEADPQDSNTDNNVWVAAGTDGDGDAGRFTPPALVQLPRGRSPLAPRSRGRAAWTACATALFESQSNAGENEASAHKARPAPPRAPHSPVRTKAWWHAHGRGPAYRRRARPQPECEIRHAPLSLPVRLPLSYPTHYASAFAPTLQSHARSFRPALLHSSL